MQEKNGLCKVEKFRLRLEVRMDMDICTYLYIHVKNFFWRSDGRNTLMNVHTSLWWKSGASVHAETLLITSYLGNVPGLKEVGRLENLLVRHPVLLDGGHEGLDVLHEEESRTLHHIRNWVRELVKVSMFGGNLFCIFYNWMSKISLISVT